MVDFKKLLIKYIMHVANVHGGNLLYYIHRGESLHKFSKEELKELKDIQENIK